MLSSMSSSGNSSSVTGLFGKRGSSSVETAIAATVSAQGRFAPTSFIAEPGLRALEEVSVTPTDYAHDPVVGGLIGLNGHEVVVERNDERAGLVHVHFPRIAFQIKPTASAIK